MRLCYVSPRHDPARAHGHVKLLHGGARLAAKPTASKAAVHTIVHSALHEAQESQHSHELVIVFWAQWRGASQRFFHCPTESGTLHWVLCPAHC